MPNSWLPPAEQGTKHSKEGVILIGDSWNMRHPLTGGGMTVAFNDVVILSKLLLQIKDFSDWDAVSHALHQWHWSRKSLSSTVNILSVALYDLFGADGEYQTHPFSLPRNGPDRWCFVVDEYLAVLRNGCFKYFERGGECVNGPVSLLSAYVSSLFSLDFTHVFSYHVYGSRVAQDPFLLFRHFFAVAFYSIWCMFTHPRRVSSSTSDKPVLATPGLDEYPLLLVKAFWVVR